MENTDKKNIDEELEDIVDEEENKPSFFRKIFFMFILICIIIVIYARYIGTTGLIVKEYSIKSENLPKSFNGLKLAHFSDFHYGNTTDLDNLKNIVKEINLLKADIVVFTGDLIDKNIKISDDDISNIVSLLSSVDSTYGKYYVTGDHDVKFDRYEEVFNNSDFYNLNDKYEIILSKNNESILISGANYKSNLKYLDELFKNELPSYKINIMHTPDTYDNISKYNYNLVLAGHSHNGQVNIPFYGAVYTPNGAKKYYEPYYKLRSTDMYVSSGIGTSDSNFRLFNRPSFNLYRLNSK